MIEQSKNIKRRLLFLMFWPSIVFGLIILSVVVTKIHFFNIYVALGLIIGSWLRNLFSERHYLFDFSILSDSLYIGYYTSQLKRMEFEFSLTGIEGIEIAKGNWLTGDSPGVQIKYEGYCVNFLILDKKLVETIKGQVAAANIGLPQCRL